MSGESAGIIIFEWCRRDQVGIFRWDISMELRVVAKMGGPSNVLRFSKKASWGVPVSTSRGAVRMDFAI